MQSYKQALKYLDSSINYEKTGFTAQDSRGVDLGKLNKALERLGKPHHSYQSVHIAGTKGKGSVSTFTSFILEKVNFRVGLFTSPHLLDPLERIKINNKNISEEDFVFAIELLKKRLGNGLNKKFTYFEIFTLMAMLLFREKYVDYAIFEVGLGGRLDATNVINAEVSCITPISFDHTEVLGDTLEKIAQEKAAIIKKGKHCVCSHQSPAVLDVIKERCAQEKASFSILGKDTIYQINKLDETGALFDIYTREREYKNCRINMLGDFQVSNCALAITICEHLSIHRSPGLKAGVSPQLTLSRAAGAANGLKDKGIDDAALKQGIKDAFIPGRLEIISRRPLIIIDGAQNGDSAEKLNLAIKKIFRYNKLILILGISRDKDVKEVCRHLTPLADEIILTRAQVERAMDPYLIKGYIRDKKATVTQDTKEALGLALKFAEKNDLILATGSFFVIGEIRKLKSQK